MDASSDPSALAMRIEIRLDITLLAPVRHDCIVLY